MADPQMPGPMTVAPPLEPAPAVAPMGWQQALAMLIPMAVAGIKGGGPGLGGFGEGFSRGRAVYDEMALRQRHQAAVEASERYAQSRDVLGDQRYQDEQRRREADEFMRALEAMPGLADQVMGEVEASGTAVDVPDMTAKQLTELLDTLGQKVPLFAQNRDLLVRGAGDLKAKASARKLAKLKPLYDRMTKDADPAYLARLRADTRPLFDGLTFADLEQLLPPEARWVPGPPKVETPVNSLEALLARAVAKGDEREAARIRGEIARSRVPSTETGSWTDTGRVNEQGEAIYINSKTMQTRVMPFGAKPDLKDQQEQARKRTVVVDATQRTLDAVDELLTPDGTLRPETRMAIGASRLLGAQHIPGSEALNAQAMIDRVKARLVTDLLAELKAQSRTGATGFGQLNLQELKIMQDSAAKLNPNQSERAFEAELRRIRQRLEMILKEPAAPRGGTVTPSASAPAASPKKVGRFEILEVK